MAPSGEGSVYVSAWQSGKSMLDETLKDSQLFVTCNVDITYQSDNTPSPPTIHNHSRLPRRIIDHKSSLSFRFPLNSITCFDYDKTISSMVSYMNITFPLEDLRWRPKVYGEWTQLDSELALIRVIAEFARSLVVNEGMNMSSTTSHAEYRMHVNIEKKVILPPRDYEAMVKIRRSKEKEQIEMDGLKNLLVEHQVALRRQFSRKELCTMAQDTLRMGGGMTLDERSLESLAKQVERLLVEKVRVLRRLESGRSSRVSVEDSLENVKVVGSTLEVMGSSCRVCLEELQLGAFVSRLPCTHLFHRHCILNWVANGHDSCPYCRASLAA